MSSTAMLPAFDFESAEEVPDVEDSPPDLPTTRVESAGTASGIQRPPTAAPGTGCESPDGVPDMEDSPTSTPATRVESAERASEEQDPMAVPVKWPHRRRDVLTSWKWETLALVVACCAIASMVAVLVHFDGRRNPEWPVAINLTTIVAVTVTVFKAALLAAMAEIISHTKWLWFRKRHEVMDFQRFDEASRGSLGAMKFLSGGGIKTLTGSLGAAVVLLSAAVGPFSQQAIGFVPCLEPNPGGDASIPVVNLASGGYTRFGVALYNLSPDFTGAMVNAVANPAGTETLAATCSTGNCTFPEHGGITHSTMGFCRACIDVSSWIAMVYENKTLEAYSGFPNYTLPRGPKINMAQLRPALSSRADNLEWLPSGVFGDMAAAFAGSLANFTAMVFTSAPCALSPGAVENGCRNNLSVSNGAAGTKLPMRRPLGVSCAFYACLKNFYGSVDNGRLNEVLVSTVPATTSAETIFRDTGVRNYTALKTPCQVGGSVYDTSNFSILAPNESYTFETVIFEGNNVSAPYECIFKLDWAFGFAAHRYFHNYFFPGSCVNTQGYIGPPSCDDEVFWLNGFWADGATNLTYIEGAMERLATAATNKVRVDDHGRGGTLYRRGYTPLVNGTAYDAALCVRIRWLWLVLPWGLLGVGMALLVGVVVRGVREEAVQPVWKSSVLPLLYGNGFMQDSPRLPYAYRMDELEDMARKTKVVIESRGRDQSDEVLGLDP
ncbi:hypothetical protein QBC39DRAFT_347306 [Podospora conica]|nr:hypothetical protein QBC39DRAFT_347306 [Schizothecium conicum]